ncbi:cation diffusion facilitator family transporter [Ruminococcaceae bacterium OttesenSCG-928-O06]|nr:cation diffusion facilitator family transporter [Ruminococcaceae bacterium OttesenSCG-928-O06]
MTNLLARLFVKDWQNTQSPAVRARYGKMAGWVGIVCNLLLAAGKLLVGVLSGSIAIAGDAVNNFSDAAASVITLVGFSLSARPADKEHPFGHARYEQIAALAVAVLVLVIGLELAKSSVEKILRPTPVDFSTPALVVLAVAVLVKLWMAAFNRSIGRRMDSATLAATFVDSRNDAITTAVVLVAAVVARFTGLGLDGWMGAAVALFIIVSGARLVKDTLDPLLGTAPDPALVRRLAATIQSYPGVLGTHDLIVHDYGPGRRFASAHVEMASEEDVLKSHEVIDRIERDVYLRENIHLIIHYDPVATRGAAVDKDRAFVANTLAAWDARLTLHDFRLLREKGRLTYVFDLVVPPDFAMDDEEIKRHVAGLLQQPGTEVDILLTVDRSFAAMPGEQDENRLKEEEEEY